MLPLIRQRHPSGQDRVWSARQVTGGEPDELDEETLDLARRIQELIEVDRFGHIGVDPELVATQDVVSTTTGISQSSGSDLIAASTSLPSYLGKFRSIRINPGRGAVE